jgi:hypothetical protein
MEGEVEKRVTIRMGEGTISIPRSKFDRVVSIADEVRGEGVNHGFIKEVSRRSQVSKGGVAAILKKKEQMEDLIKKLRGEVNDG